MRKVPRAFENAARFFHLETWFRLLLLCVLIGIVAGLGAYGFDFALRYLSKVVLDDLLFKNVSEGHNYWMLMAIPAAGGALVGVLGLLLAPEAVGHGTDAVIRAFHRNKGEIRARIPLVKGMLSILTIGSGGSAGKEGPIVQIGAGFGSTLATWLKLSIRDRRILMLAGVAGGIGAIFKAPLGGALFAAEFLYRDPDFEHDAVIPGVISSVTAYSVFTAIDGNHDLIFKFIQPNGSPLPPITFPSDGSSAFGELLHYAILSLICATVAFVFVKGIKLIEHYVFKPLPLPKVIKPALGGAMLGLFALLLMFAISHVSTPPNQTLGGSSPTHIMSGGYDYLQSVINSAQDNTKTDVWVAMKLAGFLALVVVAKIISTGFTLGSGGSGGLLFPSIFVGGIAGAAYAKFIRAMDSAGLVPSFLAMQPNARVGMILVGMGGVFAACTKTPIASLVMISEITGSYGLAVPLMMTCASAYLLSNSFTMNEEQVNGMADSPAHRGDFLINVLEEITVADVLAERASPPEMIPADMPFPKVLERIKISTASVFAVVDERQCLSGIFSLGDIRQIMNEQMVASLIVAGDLATTDVPTVTPETNLDEALRLFTQKNLDELPVVESTSRESAARTRVSSAMRVPRGPTGTRRVVGMLSRRDLIAAYHRKLHAIQSAGILESTGSHVFGGAPPPEIVETSTVIVDEELLTRETLPASADASSPTEDMLKEPPDDSDTRL